MNWNQENVFLFVYCIFLVGNYIAALLEYHKNKQQLKELSESELQAELLQLPRWKLIIMDLVGAFILKWLIYIFAFLLIGNMIVLIISLILVVLRIYLMYHKLADLQKTKLDWYVLIGETLFTVIFTIYYFGFVL